MKTTITLLTLIAGSVALVACGTVRQADLNAWVGMPVEALDTQSFFITLPMSKRMTSSGIEVRNYTNTKPTEDCDDIAYGAVSKSGKAVNAYGTSTCTSSTVGCNNIFYIKDGKVLEYAPTGMCMTDERVRPQRRHLNMVNAQ